MSKLAMLATFLVLFGAMLLAVSVGPKKGDVVVIRCDIAEISPDFTTEMREVCRKARMDQIKK